MALSQEGDRAHVPFRDSKLTRILKDSLAVRLVWLLVVVHVLYACVCLGPLACLYKHPVC